MSNRQSNSQDKILAFIKNEIKLKGYPPSVREICDAVGLKSTSTVHGHIKRLEKRGLIRRDSTKPRALEVLGEESEQSYLNDITYVPLIGTITAGIPILAQENIEEEIPLPPSFVSPDTSYFMLRVKGESMINAGIFDGDYVLVRQQSSCENGDIIVALLDDSATVKRFFKENGFIRLQPENDFMDPIFVTNLVIQGKVVGLLRKM